MSRPSLAPILLLPATFALAACATPPPPPVAAGDGCDAAAAQHHVGHIADPAMVEAARKDAGAGVARTLSPGQVVTMEYRGDRLNLHIDGDRKITRITCG